MAYFMARAMAASQSNPDRNLAIMERATASAGAKTHASSQAPASDQYQHPRRRRVVEFFFDGEV